MLLSAGRSAVGRSALLSSALRLLGTMPPSHEGSSAGSSRNIVEPWAWTSFSSSLSPRSRRALFTNPSLGSDRRVADPASWHPTEEAESHSSVPEGATLAEEGERAVTAAGSSSSPLPPPPPPPPPPPLPPKRNKKAPPPRSPPATLDPLRTADALWPQSNAQRRVGQRVHRALQAILSRPRSATLPEAVSGRLLGSGCGLALAGARASPDGKSVFVLYDCSPGTEDAARGALRAAAGPLRAAVSRVAGLKRAPRLVFVRDGEGRGGGTRGSGGGSAGAGAGEGLPARRRERSGGTVGEIEAEMARLGLLGGGDGEVEGEEDGEEDGTEAAEEGEEGEGRGSRL